MRKKISLKQFKKGIRKFPKNEHRSKFFEMAQNLFKKGFKLEACILILATWNFAGFRYKLKKFSVKRLQKTLNKVEKEFKKMERKEFKTIKFKLYKNNIIRIYKRLSRIPGIKYTGATKIMHLRLPKVFIMWDKYIRGSTERRGYLQNSNKIKRYYRDIIITDKNNKTKYPKYKKTGSEYVRFLIDMQKNFYNLNYFSSKKTFAKAIDEFNYINLTLPIQRLEKRKAK